MMKKASKNIIVFSIILCSVILAITGYIILPDTLIMQVTFSGESGTTMPKIFGLAIPFFVSVIFSVLYYKNEGSKKYLFAALIGIFFYILTFIFNLK